MNKFRQYSLLMLIVILATSLALFLAARSPELIMVFPEKDSELMENDFIIESEHGAIVVGASSFEQVSEKFPDGSLLGMSTVYSSNNSEYLFTFTKESNLLQVFHISVPGICTSRGIAVNDPFAEVVVAYGNNYAYVKRPESKDFDAVYGDEKGSIVFQVRNNLVAKIILQRLPEY